MEKQKIKPNAKAHVGYPSATLPSSADSGAVTCAKGLRKESWCFLSTINDSRGIEIDMKPFSTVTTVKCSFVQQQPRGGKAKFQERTLRFKEIWQAVLQPQVCYSEIAYLIFSLSSESGNILD